MIPASQCLLRLESLCQRLHEAHHRHHVRVMRRLHILEVCRPRHGAVQVCKRGLDLARVAQPLGEEVHEHARIRQVHELDFFFAHALSDKNPPAWDFHKRLVWGLWGVV